jgi:hypothetical protein
VWIKDEFTSVSSQDTFRFVYTSPTGVGSGALVPEGYSLVQNYPNPFNPGTLIRYSVPTADHVSVKVLNALGEEVATLVNEVRHAGEYDLRFDGSALPSGMYFYRMTTSSGYSETRKMVLLK